MTSSDDTKVCEAPYAEGQDNLQDLVEAGKVRQSDISFWSQNGDSGKRWDVLNPGQDKVWKSSKDEHPNLILQFKCHSFMLENIAIGSTPNQPLVEFAVHCYNGHNWEYVLHSRTNAFKDEAKTIVWEIPAEHKSTKYYGVCIESRQGQFNLYRVRLFGKIMKLASQVVPDDAYTRGKVFKPKKMPTTIDATNKDGDDIIAKAQKIYGPDLKDFADLWSSDAEGFDRRNILYDNDKAWRAKKGSKSITLYFPDYALQISDFCFRFAKPLLKSWAMIGYTEDKDDFHVMGNFTTKASDVDNKRHFFELKAPFNQMKFRVIKIVSPEEFGLTQVEFYGTATLDTKHPINEKYISIVPSQKRIQEVNDRQNSNGTGSPSSSAKPKAAASNSEDPNSDGTVVAKFNKDEYSPDIFEKAQIKASNLSFWAQNGDSGKRWLVLSNEEKEVWQSSNEDHPSLTIQFKTHAFTLEKIGLGSSPTCPLTEFAIHCYNGTNWEYVLNAKTDSFNKKSDVVLWEIEKEYQSTKYYGICIESRNGQFLLHRVKMFGTIEKSKIEVPKDAYNGNKVFNPPKMPKTIEAIKEGSNWVSGIFKQAQKIYGPDLEDFCDLWSSDASGHDRRDIILENDKSWVSRKGSSAMILYFKDYAIQLKEFCFKFVKPILHQWYILGFPENTNTFQVIGSYTNSDETEDKFHFYEISPPFDETPFKLIKIIGPSEFGLKQIEFFGKAVLDEREFDEKYISPVPTQSMIKKTLNKGNKQPPKNEAKDEKDKKSDNKSSSDEEPKDPSVTKVKPRKNDDNAPDLIEEGGVQLSELSFWAQNGDTGERWNVLSNDENELWHSSKDAHPSLTIQFKEHALTLSSIVIGSTPKEPIVDIAVFAFNSKNWEYILHVKTEAFTKSSKLCTFEIPEEFSNTLYYGICVESRQGSFCLHRLKFYGTIEQSKWVIPDKAYKITKIFKPPEMPPTIESKVPTDSDNQFVPGIFNKMQNIYGPDLYGFVDIYTSDERGFNREDILFESDKKWKMKKGSHSLTFYFPEFAMQVQKYYLKLVSPMLHSWYLLGYREADKNVFEVIDDNVITGVKEGKEVVFQINPPFSERSYKIIKLISKIDEIGLQQIELYGTAHYDTRKFLKESMSIVPNQKQIQDVINNGNDSSFGNDGPITKPFQQPLSPKHSPPKTKTTSIFACCTIKCHNSPKTDCQNRCFLCKQLAESKSIAKCCQACSDKMKNDNKCCICDGTKGNLSGAAVICLKCKGRFKPQACQVCGATPY